MGGIGLLVLLFLAVVLLIVSISKWKVHPFLALMAIALFLALFSGIPIKTMPKIIGSGFSGIFSSIGIVIIFGTLIGTILEKTQASVKIADIIVTMVGKKRPELAILIMGWVVSIPVFCDSGFVILNPIRKALLKETKASSVTLSIALASGLYVAHVFIPPTPGPIAAAGMLGVGENLIGVILFGVLVSIPCLAVAYFFAKRIGQSVIAEDEKNFIEETYQEVMKNVNLPSGFMSFSPIIVPIVLMAISSIISMIEATGIIADILYFLGTPIIALATGLLFGIWLLKQTGHLNTLYDLTNNTLQVTGPILFITAAGAVLGKIIAGAGFADLLLQNANSLATVGIFFPFIIAAILKTAQGSSTVAIVTTAGLMGAYDASGSMMEALGLVSPTAAMLVVMAIGAGAMTISHANDSYFWVVTKFGMISAENGYKTHSLATLLMGFVGIVFIWILSLFLL